MWIPKSNLDYKKYYGKKIFVRLLNDRIEHGILKNISEPNTQNHYTLSLKFVHIVTILSITSDIIKEIFIDHSLINIFRFKNIEGYLVNKLNYDVTKIIEEYFKNNLVYI